MKAIVSKTLSVVLGIVLFITAIAPVSAAPVSASSDAGKIKEFIGELYYWNNVLGLYAKGTKKGVKYQFYLRETAKYVKTVKAKSAAYKKYKKDSRYVLVKNKKQYKVYKTVNKKFKKIATSQNGHAFYRKLSLDSGYEMKARAVKGSVKGKFSKTLSFYSIDKGTLNKYKAIYDEHIGKMKQLGIDVKREEDALETFKQSHIDFLADSKVKAAEYKIQLNELIEGYKADDTGDSDDRSASVTMLVKKAEKLDELLSLVENGDVVPWEDLYYYNPDVPEFNYKDEYYISHMNDYGDIIASIADYNSRLIEYEPELLRYMGIADDIRDRYDAETNEWMESEDDYMRQIK